jgi:hypothetical protein
LEASKRFVRLGPARRPSSLRQLTTMTIIRISDSSLLEPLLADLRARPDVVAEAVAHDRLRISLLGSYSQSAMRMAILLRIRAWEAVQRARGYDVDVDLE